MTKSDRRSSGDATQAGLWARKAIPILGFVGLCISGYLTYVSWKVVEPVCLPLSDCSTVLANPYAKVQGVSLAVLGLAMYVVLTGLGLLGWQAKNPREGLISLGTYGVALTGTLYSAYLFYLELFEIHAVCTWCLASALVVAIILVLSLRRLLAAEERATTVVAGIKPPAPKAGAHRRGKRR
jgi:uncharacterized membrane protein